MDPKANLHENQQLQLRILRIDADRRRLGLSLRQADALDTKESAAESSSIETGASTSSGDMMMSLEQTLPRSEETQAEKEGGTSRREGKGRERPERPPENSLLNNIALGDNGETTAMAEAFRAAARQRSKDETEAPEE